jgi:hypothetical protein
VSTTFPAFAEKVSVAIAASKMSFMEKVSDGSHHYGMPTLPFRRKEG